jgi:hypothetical protein
LDESVYFFTSIDNQCDRCYVGVTSGDVQKVAVYVVLEITDKKTVQREFGA